MPELPIEDGFAAGDVAIREVAPVRVAAMTHAGDPATIETTIARFIAWRRAAGLTPAVSATYTIFHSDPDTTPPDQYRLDLCAATEGPIAPPAREEMIPGGRRAVLWVAAEGRLAPAAAWLCGQWLPASGERRGAFPLYGRRWLERRAVELFLPLG